ncbi:hypothetical protein N7450_004865 [Penicillium hetheringtonii]|uniref:RRM domain-containing protein n=1 Tax=Penicillium hetheringtonii TaxID=911720 RepID=A0AAD6GUT3_9EURO|nr:hypothetical protein N7450_004865 [Penicillium hetheringtonii]
MTPSSPDEALHFRGKTLTPESPRPLHIPEPANIPVLENQMDPVFNDTSTYDRPGCAQTPFQSLNQHDGWSNVSKEVGVGSGGQDRDRDRDAGSLHGAQQPEDPTMVNDNSVSAPESYSSTSAGAQQANNNLALADSNPSHAPPVIPVPQSVATTGEIDNTGNSLIASSLPGHLEADAKGDNAAAGDLVSGSGSAATGVNFQTLLDNLSHPPAAATATTGTVAVPSLVEPSSAPQGFYGRGIPIWPIIFIGHSVYESPPPALLSKTPPPPTPTTLLMNPAYATESSNHAHQNMPSMTPGGPPSTGSGVGALPPPPIASFQQSQQTPSAAESQTSQETLSQTPPKKGRIDKTAVRPSKAADDDSPWGPEVQKKYDEFLHDERIYVTEGLWDRFPIGSRLFVGNLPTERVTKRDMFHLFHKYGKLAQISIKQAYGFIQFLEAGACHAALQAEQGALVRGRKIHLEISKPQRSTRPGPAEPVRAPPPRRSRSPEFSRTAPVRNNVRAPGDRFDRPHETARLPFSDFRDEPSHRRRDDYRPPRSPSPRPSRRDGYRSRDRTPERLDRRRRSRSPRSPRSPYARDRRYRSPSPRPRGIYEGEADLPVPRRSPRDVPEVQVLVLEEVDRNFILHVENAFRNRGLRVDVLVLGPRIPLGAAVHRQYIEGVLAVVRLSLSNQFSRKIPLQIFDRSAGPANVRFSDYPEVEPNIAAEVMFHQAQAMQRGPVPASFAPNPAFGVPQMQPVPMPQPGLPPLSNPPNIANLIGSLDASGAPVTAWIGSAISFSSPNPPPPANLASLLTGATRHPPAPQNPQQPLLHPPFAIHPPAPPVVSDPNLLSLLAKGLGGQAPQGQAPVGSNVQNLMNHLLNRKQ